MESTLNIMRSTNGSSSTKSRIDDCLCRIFGIKHEHLIFIAMTCVDHNHINGILQNIVYNKCTGFHHWLLQNSNKEMFNHCERRYRTISSGQMIRFRCAGFITFVISQQPIGHLQINTVENDVVPITHHCVDVRRSKQMNSISVW